MYTWFQSTQNEGETDLPRTVEAKVIKYTQKCLHISIAGTWNKFGEKKMLVNKM